MIGSNSSWEKELRVAVAAAEAGTAQLVQWQGRGRVSQKGEKDFVSDADISSQREILSVLRSVYPEHQFVAEESARIEAIDPDRPCWFIDPLDGTTNFIHGLPLFAVSIALVIDGQPVVGVVAMPGQFPYLATRGGGSWQNDRQLHVSGVQKLGQALVVGSLPAAVRPGDLELMQFLEVLYRAQSIRRLGSCAINLGFLAEGRLDGYWATTVQSWDVAAGALLVAEAGGLIKSVDGSDFNVFKPHFIAAATFDLWQEMWSTLEKATLPSPD